MFGALGPIGPSSPGLALGGLAVSEHRLSNKLLAWSGVLEWQEVSVRVGAPVRPMGQGVPHRFLGVTGLGVWAETLAPATEAQALL